MNKLALDKQEEFEFSCEKDALSEALATTFRAAATKTSVGILTGALVEARSDGLLLSATDGNTTIQTSLGARVAKTGSVVLHRIFGDIIKALPSGPVRMRVAEDGFVHVAAGRSKFSLRAYPRDQFPQVPSVVGLGAETDAQDFATMLARVVIAASHDRARPVLNSVLFETTAQGTRLVATDSYRLAIAETQTPLFDNETNVLVSARSLNEVAKLCAHMPDTLLNINADEQRVAFETDMTTVVAGRLQEDFPNYKQVVPPQHANCLTIDREHFLTALSRVALFARALTPVRLDMAAGAVSLRAVDAELGGEALEELDANYEGDAITCAFNPLYLREGLEACGSQVITLESSDPFKPAMLRPDQADYRYILMPVRL